MPARPSAVEILCAAAAVVEYIRCPDTKQLKALPAGTRPTKGQAVHLTLDAN